MMLLSLVSISRIKFESDVFQLFPARSGPLKLFLDTLKWTGGANEAYFIIEGDQNRVLDESQRFAKKLEQIKIDGSPAFNRVTYRLYEEADAAPFAKFVGHAVITPELFLPPDKLHEYLERLSNQGETTALQGSVASLASQAGMGIADLLTADPINLREFILPRLKKGGQALDLDPASPYFLSRDHQLLIMIAYPAKPVQDMDFTRKLAASINEARKGFDLKISCAGAHVSAAIDEASMKHEILACILSSLVLILAIFFFTYRRILPTLLLPIIVVWGFIIAMGIAGVILPSIHIIAFAFTALIIGLGTDYSIHLYDRFHFERNRGKTTDEALQLASVHTGHAIFTAATTTAFPFLCLSFADVKALSQLGLLVGIGVLTTMYATFLFLPPLLLFMEKRFPQKQYAALPTFGLGRIWKVTGRFPLFFRVTSIILVIVAIISATGVKFEKELKNLQPKHSEAFLTQEKIEKHLSISPKQMIVAIDGKEQEEVLKHGESLDRIVAPYLKSGKISDYSSIGMLLNPPETRETINNALKTALAGRDLKEETRLNLEKAGFAPESFTAFLDGIGNLNKTSDITTETGIEMLEASPLKGIVTRHLAKDNEGYHLLSYIYYTGSEFSVDSFLKGLHQQLPEARATSIDLVSNQLAELVKRNFIFSAFLGVLIVLFLLFSHFSKMSGVFSSLFPVMAGTVSMIALMALTGMKINFMNAMVLVTLMGMGSDYGMHIAYRVEDSEDKKQAFIQSSRAVLLSAFTTIAGFGSLAIADYGALASIGWATNFGVGATTLFAIVALPAFFKLNRGISQN